MFVQFNSHARLSSDSRFGFECVVKPYPSASTRYKIFRSQEVSSRVSSWCRPGEAHNPSSDRCLGESGSGGRVRRRIRDDGRGGRTSCGRATTPGHQVAVIFEAARTAARVAIQAQVKVMVNEASQKIQRFVEAAALDTVQAEIAAQVLAARCPECGTGCGPSGSTGYIPSGDRCSGGQEAVGGSCDRGNTLTKAAGDPIASRGGGWLWANTDC